ncbi:hypothetical protein KPL71_021611 [Citrus sinensis]|uniref:Uncharacterized protein n=1 Tax=Citrus sinensis TaxID=2711 RepID=A0ACB8JGY8_CITSI|nr:hypothetical protein KPL71_021611 [Citrus sinensis]
MSPSDLLFAKQECSQLLQQGLIEPTDSDWACQAFYVEKRSELVRGKKRLVIDYQSLNSFLKDDKFPLPKIQTLFVHLQGAQIFSKFDLKAGFWQLGISPVDRPKTAFCIPDAHYQWTVMPFGLKVAPSLFQKAMTKIFSPILHHALVYIDDILLFSPDHDSHQQLLLDFFYIVQVHGIMLSEKKSSIAKESIDFLGMVITNGHYQPGPHIATELLKFPDTNLTKKQIQQFFGIVNYVRDFILRVAIHTSQLSRMLKKQYPPWGPAQTEAVKQLKVIAQSPPPLRIPTTGQRILQTDASDDYWSAILLERIDGMDHFCAYASGQFKESKKNYHVIYKEILAVNYRIKNYKNKLLPDKQLLNLKTWFSKYDFTVQHIKGKQNLIPDFLTRPAINKPSLLSSTHIIPVIAMNRQLPFKALNQRLFPMNIPFSSAYQIQDFAKKFLYRYFFNVHSKTLDHFPTLCMENLFLKGLTLSHLSISEDELCSTPASPSVPPPTISQPPTQSKDKEPMHQFTAHTVAHSSTHSFTIDDQTSDSNLAVSDSHTETDTEPSASTSDSEKSYADITKILMAQPDQPTQGQTSHTEPYVDIPSEVKEEMHESSATNQPSPAQAQTNPPSQKSSNGATTQSVLREFATRFMGALRDWFDSLGQYRQLQFVDLLEVSSALAVLHDQFLGDPSAVFEVARRDYLNMKCCSLNAKDLDFPYKRMSLLFYKLNGFNEPTLNMLNPHILPPTYWTKSEEHFKAVNGKLFTTSLITKKPIGIQIFPNCVIWTKVIGSTLPNKDILLGFDILYQIKHLQIIPTGIRVKSMFKPFTDVLKLYNLSETPQSYQDISTKLLSFCPESHSEFTDPNPLWKNMSFFIKLPFKLNEDINPTKATHPGMSPSDLLLAQTECSHDEHRQLLTQFYDIIHNHGIMLSVKKSTIATDNIEFLGMIIKNGHYQPGKHIAQELLHFPDQHLSKKQVQQLLGIINYIRDFIPHVDHYTHHISALLKKKPPEWNADHTTVVITLKQIAQNPPPLKLITDGKRILQTDASDES